MSEVRCGDPKVLIVVVGHGGTKTPTFAKVFGSRCRPQGFLFFFFFFFFFF